MNCTPTDESTGRFIHWPPSPKRPSPRQVSYKVEAQLMIRHWPLSLAYSSLTIAVLAFASGPTWAQHGGGGGHGGGGHGGGGHGGGGVWGGGWVWGGGVGGWGL